MSLKVPEELKDPNGRYQMEKYGHWHPYTQLKKKKKPSNKQIRLPRRRDFNFWRYEWTIRLFKKYIDPKTSEENS